MIQNLTVGINSDFSGLERGVASLFAQLGRIGQAALQAGSQITGGFGQATTAVNQYRDAQGRLREANGRFSGSNNNALGSLGKLTLGYFSAAQALDLLKQGLGIVSDFQRLDGGLKAVSSSATDFAATQAFLRRQSDQLGLSYEVLAGTYKGLKAATNDTALAGAETERIFTSVVRAGAALRLSNEQVEGTLLAIQQMLSKGVVSMEELRQQLGERLPAAFGLAAKAMGVSTAELNKMVASGNVLAVDLLPKLATELEKAYGAQAQANVNSMAGGFTRATDQLKLFISEFAKTAGVDTFFGKIGNGIANVIKDLRRMQTGNLQTEYNDFLGLSLPEKEKELSRLAGDINRAQAKLNTLVGSSPTDANLKAESSLEKRIDSMKKLYGAYFMAVRDGQSQAAKAAGVGGAKTFDIESAKNRQSELAKGIATARLNGQNPTALQREYDALTARIDAATASTKRHTAAHVAAEPTITTNERLLKRYTQALKQYGDTADGARSRTVALLQDAVALDKARANNKPVDIGRVNAITPAFDKTAIAQALTGTANMPKLPGLDAFQKNAKENLDNLRQVFASFKLPGIDVSLLKRSKDEMLLDIQAMKEGIRSTLEQTAETALSGMAAVIGGLMAGTTGVEALPNLLLDTLGGLMIQLGQIAIQTAIGIGAIQAALKTLNPVVAAVAGVALIALGTVVKSGVSNLGSKGSKMPAFAAGGTLFGPTVGLMGEYPGASRNPEFVAPVNKGAGMIAEQLMQMGGFGGGPIEIFGKLDGSDIWLSGRRYEQTRRNFGS